MFASPFGFKFAVCICFLTRLAGAGVEAASTGSATTATTAPAATRPAEPVATTTAPAQTQPADDADAPGGVLSPDIRPAPGSDEEIRTALAEVQQRLADLQPPASQPSTAPATNVADELAQVRWNLAEALRSYAAELQKWQTIRAEIVRLKSPETLDQLAQRLDVYRAEQTELSQLALQPTDDVEPATLDEAQKRLRDLDARLQKRAAAQTQRDEQLASISNFKNRTDEAIRQTLQELTDYLARLAEDSPPAAEEEAHAVALLRKQVLEWRHNLQLLVAATYGDLATQLQLAQQQDADRINTLRDLVVAQRDYVRRLEKVRSQSQIDRISEQLARDDLPPWQRTYWEVRLDIAKGLARATDFNAETRGLFSVEDLERLRREVARNQGWTDFMASLSRRPGETILEAYRRIKIRLAEAETTLSDLETRLDLVTDELYAAQDESDWMLDRIRRGRQKFEEQIRTLTGDALTEARRRQGELTEAVASELQEGLDAVLDEMAATRERLRTAIPAQAELTELLTQYRSQLYWQYLLVPGRNLLARGWDRPGLTAEWNALRTGYGEIGRAWMKRVANFTNQCTGVPVARWGTGILFLGLVVYLALRTRRRMGDQLERLEKRDAEDAASVEPSAPAADESVSEQVAHEVASARRLHVQGLRAVRRTALFLGPLVAALVFLHASSADVPSLPIVTVGLATVALAIGWWAGIAAFFDARRPQWRIIQCEDRVARYHRFWLTLIGVAAFLLLPSAFLLRAVDLFPLIRGAWWDVASIALLTLFLVYTVRREFFVPPVDTQAESFSWRRLMVRRCFPLLPLAFFVLILARLAGYAALVEYLLRGALLTALLLLIGRAIRHWLTGVAVDPAIVTSAAGGDSAGGAAKTSQSVPPVVALVTQVLRLLVLLVTWFVVLEVWGVSFVEIRAVLTYSLLDTGKGNLTLWRLVAAGGAVAVSATLSRSLRAFLHAEVFPQSRHLDRGTQAAISALLHYSFIALGIYVAMQFALIDLGALAILLGTLGLGLGLGLQPLFVNFISGVIILLERQVKVGDLIEVNGQPGEVTTVSMRSTTIKSFDNVDFVIPNGDFINGQVTNWTLNEPRIRARLDVGVAYGSDVQLVRKILLDVAYRHPNVLVDPAPNVWFMNFGDSSLDFTLVCWFSNPSSRWDFLSQIRFEIERLFRENGIEIPFPQRTLSVIGDRPLPIELRRGQRPANDGAPSPAADDRTSESDSADTTDATETGDP